MAGIRVMSTDTIQAVPSHHGSNSGTTQKIIHLAPWDLEPLPLEMNQKGLLFHNHTNTISNQIQHLKNSLSATLSFFPPLAGRLVITEHEEDGGKTASAHILCNNAGALFVHAVAEAENDVVTRVSDILQSKYVPPMILRSFFQLNGVRNYQGTSHPLLALQVTELLDGVFIGITINHVVADGESLWHFVNSWSQTSRRGGDKPSKAPSSFQRWFLDGVNPPIHFPPIKKEEPNQNPNPKSQPQVRIFHFSKEKIAKLKLRANAEARCADNKISSLQALLTHLWRSVIRCQRVDPEEEVFYFIAIGVRQRMVPPLPENYFGNAVQIGAVKMRAGELLEEGAGLGKGAMEMNKAVASHGGEKVRRHYESMAKSPVLLYPQGGKCGGVKALATGSSPRFDVYGNDFGWGKPVAVRTGGSNKNEGMITVFRGAEEEGGVDVEVCLAYEILEAMGNDPDFVMDDCSLSM